MKELVIKNHGYIENDECPECKEDLTSYIIENEFGVIECPKCKTLYEYAKKFTYEENNPYCNIVWESTLFLQIEERHIIG